MIDNKPLRVLSLGWGVQSWALAAMAALGEIEPVDFAIHSDTTHEASGTYTHAEKWTPWLEERGVKVVTVRPKSAGLVDRFGGVMIPAYTTSADGTAGQIRRQCTNHWKIGPIRRYLRTVLPAHPRAGAVNLLTGISWDEALRMKDSNVQYIQHDYPLVEKRIRRSDCILWLERNGLEVPPKSSCVFCPYHNANAWKELKRHGGSDWENAVIADAEVRGSRGKGIGMELFVHPYRQPLAEAVSIPEDVGAKQLMLGDGDPTCDSGFCFT
jgi:hypothetical protein